MKYKRGDIVIVNFPFSDLSKAKKRPALIISNHLVNRTGDYLLVQISSKIILRMDGQF
jgi:mRNA interferase MazF